MQREREQDARAGGVMSTPSLGVARISSILQDDDKEIKEEVMDDKEAQDSHEKAQQDCQCRLAPQGVSEVSMTPPPVSRNNVSTLTRALASSRWRRPAGTAKQEGEARRRPGPLPGARLVPARVGTAADAAAPSKSCEGLCG